MIIGKSVKYDLLSELLINQRGRYLHPRFCFRRFIQIVKDHAKVKSISIQSYNAIDYQHKYILTDHEKINKILEQI